MRGNLHAGFLGEGWAARPAPYPTGVDARPPNRCSPVDGKGSQHIYDLKRFVRGNANIIVDYHRRQRGGPPVSTSLVESAVNHLVNRRMNKSQQMRWSTHGAHRLLEVRAAVINGEFEQLLALSTAEAAPTDQTSLPLAA